MYSLGIIYYFMIANSVPLPNRFFFAQSQAKNQSISFKVVGAKHPSAESIKFLEQTLEEKVHKRLSWRELRKHDIFKGKSQLTGTMLERLEEEYF